MKLNPQSRDCSNITSLCRVFHFSIHKTSKVETRFFCGVNTLEELEIEADSQCLVSSDEELEVLIRAEMKSGY